MNKVIVITGGSGLIGKSLTETLSKNNDVVSLSHNNCDITSHFDRRDLVNFVMSKYRRIDVLINCTGVMLFNKIEDVTEEEIDKSLDVNFKGTVGMIKDFLPVMLKQKEGSILNISSIRGISGCPGKSIYSASKFALQGFTDSLRHELKDTGVKITNICPGSVPSSVSCEDINLTVDYLLKLDKTIVRDIILGGQL